MSYQSTGIQGWMGDGKELPWLFDTASKMRSVVEIGCWRGRSTHAILSGCPGPVWAVDHFLGCPLERDSNHADAKDQDIRAQFLANVGMFPNLKLLAMESGDAAEHLGPGFRVDMVFIDAAHEYADVRRDLELWAPKARRIVSGHDFQATGVNKAVLEYFGREPDELADGVWAYRMDQ